MAGSLGCDKRLSTSGVPSTLVAPRGRGGSGDAMPGGSALELAVAARASLVAVGGGGALAPIFILAASITVIVAVALYVTKETAEKKRCKKVKQNCIEYCSDTVLPTRDYGVMLQNCKHDCLEKHGSE
jgi:hypothetical protein